MGFFVCLDDCMACSRAGAAVDGVAGDGVGADRCYSGCEGEGNEGDEMHDELFGCCL